MEKRFAVIAVARTQVPGIIKGLFYHHYKYPVPPQTSIITYWFAKPPNGFESELYINSIADGNFTYLFNKVEGSLYDSMWLFEFYKAHWAAE